MRTKTNGVSEVKFFTEDTPFGDLKTCCIAYKSAGIVTELMMKFGPAFRCEVDNRTALARVLPGGH